MSKSNKKDVKYKRCQSQIKKMSKSNKKDVKVK